MRRLVDEHALRRFMAALGPAAERDLRLYFTGGATAVLLGWRASTITVDLKLEPDRAPRPTNRAARQPIPASLRPSGLKDEELQAFGVKPRRPRRRKAAAQAPAPEAHAPGVSLPDSPSSPPRPSRKSHLNRESGPSGPIPCPP